MKQNGKIIKSFENIEDNSRSFLDIMFFPIMFCNQKCSYCFVKNNERPNTLDTKIIDNFKNFKMDLTLNLGGGEPMLIKNFNEIYEKLTELKSARVFTNGSLPLEKWKELKSSNVEFLISFHPEFAKLDHFLKLQDFLESNNFKYDFQGLYCSDEYYDLMKDFRDIFKGFNFVYPDGIDKSKIKKGLSLIKENDTEYLLDDKLVKEGYLYNNFDFNFKFCKCYINMFYYDYKTNTFSRVCDNKIYSLEELQSWTEIKPKVCVKSECKTNCYQRFYKESIK
jgi:radical SAM domain protein